MDETNDKPLAGVVRAVQIARLQNRDGENGPLALIIQRESGIAELVVSARMALALLDKQREDCTGPTPMGWNIPEEGPIARALRESLAKLTGDTK